MSTKGKLALLLALFVPAVLLIVATTGNAPWYRAFAVPTQGGNTTPVEFWFSLARFRYSVESSQDDSQDVV